MAEALQYVSNCSSSAGAEFISANPWFAPMNNSPGPILGWTGFNLVRDFFPSQMKERQKWLQPLRNPK
jgi:hypothetical protein